MSLMTSPHAALSRMTAFRSHVSGKLFFSNFALSRNTVIALSVLFMIVFDNHAFWSSLFSVIDLTDPGMYFFLFACFAVIFSVSFSFFAIFGVGRFFKPLVAFVLVLAAVTSYYMDAYGTVFDDVMVLNIIETNANEVSELYDTAIFWHVLFFGILPTLVLFQIPVTNTPKLKAFRSRAISVAAVISIATLSVYISYKDFTFVFRENREISFFVNPAYPMRSVYRFTRDTIKKRNSQFLAVFEDAHRITQQSVVNNILVMVVGETARADNFHIDGYQRNTTPRLDKLDVVNFENVSSCGTATAVSLPCMFSDLTHDNFDNNAAKNRQNLLDALDVAGLQVLWRENNPDCKGVCDRIETQQVADIYLKDICPDGVCYDEALFNGLDQYMKNIHGDAVIVLHTEGSHGPAYFRRYPENFKKFEPECRSAAVEECSDEELLNAYDNTILYTDYCLSKVIEYLKSSPVTGSSAMLYVSDHGESLGENGVYLHGLPYFMAPSYQKHIPMIAWFSGDFAQNKNLDVGCLSDKSKAAFSHDNIIHSVLGIMDVASSRYDTDLDIFASCRRSI